MALVGRKFTQTNSSYRYGFNGQENSNDVTVGNTTAMYWEYDSRIGRRWNVDPKSNTSISPYSCYMGNPILFNDRLGDTPRVEMNHTFYTLAKDKNNILQYIDDKGAILIGPLSENAINVQSIFSTALSSGNANLRGRANEILNSKFDLFITEDQFVLTGIHGSGLNELYAYKLADGSIKQALNTEYQPKNAIAAYISINGIPGLISEGTPGRSILKLGSGSQDSKQATPAILAVSHEIFGHGWQAIKGLLGPERVLNWKGGTLLGAPRKAEADAVTIQNIFAIHSGYGNLIHFYYFEPQPWFVAHETTK